MNLMQFAHGTLVSVDDHSVKVNEPHAEFSPSEDYHKNPLAEKSNADAKAAADAKPAAKK